MGKYRKKPVIIEAVQWDSFNFKIIKSFTNGLAVLKISTLQIVIPTLEGDHFANVDDYIIRGVNGEFYPCKPDIFKKTYESVD